MKELYIYGASGHGKVIFDVASSLDYKILGFIDDTKGGKFLGQKIYKPAELPKSANIFLAIGDNKHRKELSQKLGNSFSFPSLIHPSATISSSATIKTGTCIMPNVVVNSCAKIGEFCILNTACVIEHDCVIGNFTHIGGNSYLAGNVKVGNECFLGFNSGVRQGLKIADGVTLGAGAVTVKDLNEKKVYIGVPAK